MVHISGVTADKPQHFSMHADIDRLAIHLRDTDGIYDLAVAVRLGLPRVLRKLGVVLVVNDSKPVLTDCVLAV